MQKQLVCHSTILEIVSFDNFYLFIIVVCVHDIMYVHDTCYVHDTYVYTMHCVPDAYGDHRRVPDLLELQVIVKHLIFVLGTKLESSGRATVLQITKSSLQPWGHFFKATLQMQ